MKAIKQQLKASLLQVPAIRTRWERLKARHHQPASAQADLTSQEIFTRIYESNFWGDGASRSGSGSNRGRTETLRRELPPLLRQLGCRTLLDAPCGDASWISDLEIDLERYIGCDIVAALIDDNRRRHGRPGREFQVLDVARDPLPRADVVLCRDLLVHLPNADARRALDNFALSGATWLLATTFTRQSENYDIGAGSWRAVNLERPPFSLGHPTLLVDEHCDEQDGIYSDKHLGLWPLRTTPRRAASGSAA